MESNSPLNLNNACMLGIQSLSRLRKTGVLLFAASIVSFSSITQAQASPSATNLFAFNNSTMDADLFYELLLAELAILDGQVGDGFALYLRAARRGPADQLFERAMRIAISSRDVRAATQVATEWTSQLPSSSLAQNYLFQSHFSQKNYTQALAPLKALLKLTPDTSRSTVILGLNSFFSRMDDRQVAIQQLIDVLLPYQTLSNTGAAARLVLARAYLHAEQYNLALVQLESLTSQYPSDIDGWLLKGSLELQENQFANAEESLKKFLEIAKKERLASDHSAYSSAYLQLAQLAENKKDFAAAEQWLSKIEDDKDRLAGQVRRASILAKQGQLAQARELIRQVPERTTTQARAKLMAEIQLLREHKQMSTAIDLAQQALALSPNDTSLIYELSTLHEKAKNYEQMESLLRNIMAMEPNNQAAFNALGYSLADRGVRLAEAQSLIERALEIAPKDPYIMDSLGWVFFRKGQLDQALKTLKEAYSIRADAEIGAHLGEVLWRLNRKNEAIQAWKDAKAINADNETLIETLKRLGVAL